MLYTLRVDVNRRREWMDKGREGNDKHKKKRFFLFEILRLRMYSLDNS